jgi:hypothetical protein
MIRKSSLLVLAGLLAAWAAQATTILPMSLEELTRRSDSILVGKVKSVTYAQNEVTGYPETRTTITVENPVYGDDKTKEVVVAVPGGPSGNGLVTIVPGMPKFKVDERAILFLVADKNRGVSFPVGAEQGVYRIKYDSDTKQYYVLNQSRDLSVIDIPDNPIEEKNVGKSKVLLPDFTVQLRQLAIQVKEQ